jgi:hypothetical protein
VPVSDHTGPSSEPAIPPTTSALTMRQKRAALLRALKVGRVSLPSLLLRDDEIVGQLPVRRVLEALPGIGKVSAGRLLGELGLEEHCWIRHLQPTQHARLLAWSRSYPRRPR